MGMATPVTEDLSGCGAVELVPAIWVAYEGTRSQGRCFGRAPGFEVRRCLACGQTFGVESLWLHREHKAKGAR